MAIQPEKQAYEPVDITDVDALRELLIGHGFDLTHWGEGSTKPLEALWNELAEGESEIVSKMGIPTRRTNVAAVDVYATLPDARYRLAENKQVYNGGYERERGLITSLGEKIKRGETAETAVRRAVAEELGIRTVKSLELVGEQLLERESATFNGMLSDLVLYLAKVEIDPSDFRPEGYIEVQPDKSIYFNWHEIGVGTSV